MSRDNFPYGLRWQKLVTNQFRDRYTHDDVMKSLWILHDVVARTTFAAILGLKSFSRAHGMNGTFEDELVGSMTMLVQLISEKLRWMPDSCHDTLSHDIVPSSYSFDGHVEPTRAREHHALLVESTIARFQDILGFLNHIEFVKTMATMDKSNNSELFSMSGDIINRYNQLRGTLDSTRNHINIMKCHCENHLSTMELATEPVNATKQSRVNAVEKIKQGMIGVQLPLSIGARIKNRLSRVIGERDWGESSVMPWELGFECPVCKRKPKTSGGNINEVTSIQYSKYPGMLYCPACDIVIPMFSCHAPRVIATMRDVEHVTTSFIDFIEACQKRVLHARDDIETIQEHAASIDWKRSFEHLLSMLKSSSIVPLTGALDDSLFKNETFLSILQDKLWRDAGFRVKMLAMMPTCRECQHYRPGHGHSFDQGSTFNCALNHVFESHDESPCSDFSARTTGTP